MVESMYFFVFLFSLIGGAAFSVLEHRKGRTWMEALRAHALFFGFGGFAGAQVFLTGTLSIVVAWGCLIPAIWISIRQTRQALSQRAEHRLPEVPEDPEDPGEQAVARANSADFIEANKRLRRRINGAALAAGLPMVGIGAYYGSWFAVLMGGAATAIAGLLGRFITKPLMEANRLAAELALEETPPSVSLPQDPSS